MTPGSQELSVVMPTRDRCETVSRGVASLAQQRWPGAWELLVVDNGSRDGTRARIEDLAQRFPAPVRVLAEPAPGISRARNRGLREARSTLVVFADDDLVFRPGWLAAHAGVLAQPRVVATGGRVLPRLPADADPWLASVLGSEVGGPSARYDFGDEECDAGWGLRAPPPFGGNMGVLRSAALEAGGFRDDLGWGGQLVPGEDTDLCLRLSDGGGRLRYVPGAAVEHSVPAARTTRRYWRRWQRGFGRFTARIAAPSSPKQLARLKRHTRRAFWLEARRWLRCAQRGERIAAERELQRFLGRYLELRTR